MDEQKQVEGYFTKLDKNKDGTLSPEEVRAVFEKMGGLGDNELADLMRQIDTNQDGRINITEFSNWIFSSGDKRVTVYYWGPHPNGMNTYGRAIGIYLTLDQAGCPYDMKHPDQMPRGFVALGSDDPGAYAPPVVEIDGTCMAQAPMILTVLGEMLGLGGKTYAEKMKVHQALGDMNDLFGVHGKFNDDDELKKKWLGYIEKQLSGNNNDMAWMGATTEPTIADFHGVFTFCSIDNKKIDYSAYPNIAKWWTNIKAYPVVAKMFASCVNGRVMMPS